MLFVIAIIIAVYILVFAWTWHNLDDIDKTKKVGLIIIGIVINYLITLIIFSLSKRGVDYSNIPIQSEIKNILITIFTGINAIIFLPQIAKTLNKVSQGKIKKEDFTKKIVILMIIFFICMFLENGYLKDTQKVLINSYNLKNNTNTK